MNITAAILIETMSNLRKGPKSLRVGTSTYQQMKTWAPSMDVSPHILATGLPVIVDKTLPANGYKLIYAATPAP